MANVRARPETGNLYFDFHFRGVRCREYSTLVDTSLNRKKMEGVLKKIEAEIALNTFRYASFFPASPMVARFAVAANDSVVQQSATSPLFKDFVVTWKVAHQIEWRNSYRKSVDCILSAHLLPFLGETAVGDIDRDDILALRAKLGEKRVGASQANPSRPLSAGTINRIIGVARLILDDAASTYSFTNPASTLKRLKQQRVDIQPFNMDEVKRIIEAVRPDYRHYLTIRFFTAMRSAEAHGLKWKHVDFDRRELLIRETFHAGATEYTKNDGSQREISMSAPVFDSLKAICVAKPESEAYVFHTRNGHPIDNKNFNDRVWKPLLRLLELKQRRPYQMRHTCATFWLAAGENPEWIARQLGHTTTEMLFRTYSRYVPNLTRRDGTAFDRMVSAAVHGGVTGTAPSTTQT